MNTGKRAQVLLLSLTILMAVCLSAQARAAERIGANAAANTWSVSRAGAIVQIGYGSGRDFPQFAALDLHSGYFRMVYGRGSGWGASVLLLPALWSRASCPTGYCQGAPVTATWRTAGPDLILSVHGTIATLAVAVTVTMTAPADNVVVAKVSTKAVGAIQLDNRPGEAFKPVMISSMHISATRWDSSDAFTGTRAYAFPPAGWIIHPPVAIRDFGLQGGTSSWKKNAPTIEITLDHTRQVTGWVTASTNPNGDNVAFWCATATVLPSWSYTITAEQGANR